MKTLNPSQILCEAVPIIEATHHQWGESSREPSMGFHRHHHKMTSRFRSRAIIGLSILIAGIALYAFARRDPASEQIFSATINRDCAPWDGSAFTVTIPIEGKDIAISIYQSPDIKLPTAYLFPDDTMSIGNALLSSPIGSPEQLTGKVSFQHVLQDIPVEGQFDLVTNAGKHFKGNFIAEWGNELVLCG